jgi:hypothetical protein
MSVLIADDNQDAADSVAVFLNLSVYRTRAVAHDGPTTLPGRTQRPRFTGDTLVSAVRRRPPGK